MIGAAADAEDTPGAAAALASAHRLAHTDGAAASEQEGMREVDVYVCNIDKKRLASPA